MGSIKVFGHEDGVSVVINNVDVSVGVREFVVVSVVVKLSVVVVVSADVVGGASSVAFTTIKI